MENNLIKKIIKLI